MSTSSDSREALQRQVERLQREIDESASLRAVSVSVRWPERLIEVPSIWRQAWFANFSMTSMPYLFGRWWMKIPDVETRTVGDWELLMWKTARFPFHPLFQARRDQQMDVVRSALGRPAHFDHVPADLTRDGDLGAEQCGIHPAEALGALQRHYAYEQRRKTFSFGVIAPLPEDVDETAAGVCLGCQQRRTDTRVEWMFRGSDIPVRLCRGCWRARHYAMVYDGFRPDPTSGKRFWNVHRFRSEYWEERARSLGHQSFQEWIIEAQNLDQEAKRILEERLSAD